MVPVGDDILQVVVNGGAVLGRAVLGKQKKLPWSGLSLHQHSCKGGVGSHGNPPTITAQDARDKVLRNYMRTQSNLDKVVQ